jgi:Flp pilus assembly protein TadG
LNGTLGRTPDGKGQVLPLFAIVAAGMLAFMALGLDAAQAFVERRNAQGAADLASLSGARFLHDDATETEFAQAREAAWQVAEANGYPRARVTPIVPYEGDPERIEVNIDSEVNTFFAPVLTLFTGNDHSSMDVDARAVAYGGYEEAAGGGFAILALESCGSQEKSVDISGSSTDFIGRVHSNSDLYLSGSTLDFDGPASYSCGGSDYAAFHNGGGDNTFDPAHAFGSYAPSPEPDPIGLLRSDFTCTFNAPSSGMWDLSSNGAWWVGGNKDSKTLRAGTYCSRTGSSDGIKLGDSDIRIEDVASGPGGVTFVGQGYVEISGSDFQLRPHEHNILFFSYGTSDVAMKVSGSGGTWEGIIYAPRGTAEVSGSSNLAITGGIVAKRVKLNGSSLTIDGSSSGGGPGEPYYALTE